MPISLRQLKRLGTRCERFTWSLLDKSTRALPQWYLRETSTDANKEISTSITANADFLRLNSASTAQVVLPEKFRCDKSDPADHTLKEESLFYTIPKDDFDVICPKTGSRKAFIKRHIEEMEAFDEAAIMIRRPALEVINYMKYADYSLPALRYLIYGDAGAGKSITLQHVTHYCMKQGWLIVPTLYAWDWVTYKAHYKITRKEELLESLWNKERLDQPVRAIAWLEAFRTMNKQHLRNIKTSKEYIWTKRDKTEVGKPLETLVDQGIARPRLATDVIGCLMREIRLRDPQSMPRVLVTVDCVNALFAKSLVKSGIEGYVEADKLAFIHNIKKLIKEPWTNGAVVVATNGTYTTNPDQENLVREAQYTYEVLGHRAFDILDPHIPIEVANYSDIEMLSQLAYFEDRKWLVGRATTDDGRKEILEVTRNNPWEVAKFCGGLF